MDIFYLDYGQSECVSLDRICNSTPGDILSRRAMAQYITLEGVSPVSINMHTVQLISAKILIINLPMMSFRCMA